MGVGGQARGRRRVSLRVALYTYTHRNIELQVYIICSGRAGNLSFSMPPVDLLALSLFRTGTEAADYRLYHKGQMAFVKVGTGTRISADELARYIQEHSRRGTAAKQEA